MNSIIGPPYHVTKVEPTFGSIKGGTNITLTGIGFNDTRNVKVQLSRDAYQNEEAFEYTSQILKSSVKLQTWKRF